MKGSRVLVTGAGGFVGSHLVKQLVQEGSDVHALVRPSSSLERLRDLSDRISVHQCDLSHQDLVRVAKTISPEVAFHLAWFAEPGRYLHAVAENLESLSGSLKLMEALLDSGCGRLVLAGTCLEGIESRQASVYVTAKRALHSVAETLDDAAMSTVCAHIFYLFGPYEDPRRVIPQVIRSLLAGRAISVTEGEQRRDYLYAGDVAAGLLALCNSQLTGSIDICSGQGVTLRHVLELIGEETGRPDLIGFGHREYASDEIFHAVGDRAALDQLGWQPSRSLEEGLAQTVEWWRALANIERKAGGN